MGGIVTIAWQAMISPITTVAILSMTAVWVQLLFNEWDVRYFSQCYSDCVTKKQLWRILLSPLSHNSFMHLLLDAITLWNLRFIEQRYGILFFARYTILLAVAESALTFIVIYLCIKFASTQRHIVRRILASFHTYGCSGILLAWLGFYSMDVIASARTSESVNAFVVLGLFAIHPTLAPVIMVCVYYLFLPKNNQLSNLCGLMSGYLLRMGVLRVIDGFYWSLCLLFDIGVLVAASVYFREQLANTSSQISESSSSSGGSGGNGSNSSFLQQHNMPFLGDSEELHVGDQLSVFPVGLYAGVETVGDVSADDGDIEQGPSVNPIADLLTVNTHSDTLSDDIAPHLRHLQTTTTTNNNDNTNNGNSSSSSSSRNINNNTMDGDSSGDSPDIGAGRDAAAATRVEIDDNDQRAGTISGISSRHIDINSSSSTDSDGRVGNTYIRPRQPERHMEGAKSSQSERTRAAFSKPHASSSSSSSTSSSNNNKSDSKALSVDSQENSSSGGHLSRGNSESKRDSHHHVL